MTLPLLSSKILRDAGFISHGFTMRLGGVSPPPFQTLDFAVKRDGPDAPSTLAENQKRLGLAVGFAVEDLYQATQVHKNRVIVAEGDRDAVLAEEADALIAEPNTKRAVGVRIADCVPILLADPSTGRVAAVHAGWRGIEAEILSATMRQLMEANGASRDPSSYLAAIGPCIGPCCFEVGLDVADRITVAAGDGPISVIDRKVDGKAYIDLRLSVRMQLRTIGLVDECIDDVPSRGREGCTSCDKERFYSYRRDKDASGRLMGVIVSR